MKINILSGAIAAAAILSATAAQAQSAPTTVSLVLKDHKFTPSIVTVPAGKPIRIELNNQDGTADEFDSADLKAEKEFGPHSKVVIQIAPQQPGTYNFMGELHSKTATGQVVVTAQP